MEIEEPVSSEQGLPIAIDVMGGVLGPEVVVRAALRAAKETGIASVLVGDELELQRLFEKYAANESKVTIFPASEVIVPSESPAMEMRRKPDASILVCFDLVKNGKAAAVISASSPSIVMSAGLFVSAALPGLAKPALTSLLPRVGSDKPVVLLDCGANVECQASTLLKFALMGSLYAESFESLQRPRIALLANAADVNKATDVVRVSAMMLSEIKELNFVGCIEASQLTEDVADVIVCDGFVGQVVLRTMEGSVGLVFDAINHYSRSSLMASLGMWLCRGFLRKLFKEKLGACSRAAHPLLGLNHVALVCNALADEDSFVSALRQAKKFANEGLVWRIREALAALDRGAEKFEDGMWQKFGKRFERGANL